jgi:3-mercaptopyruvate sulfurtransferase SseA
LPRTSRRVRSDDPSLRLVEVDLNPAFYEAGHVPGAIGFD